MIAFLQGLISFGGEGRQTFTRFDFDFYMGFSTENHDLSS